MNLWVRMFINILPRPPINYPHPHTLTRGEVLHGSVVDEATQLLHVSAVPAAHHLHLLFDPRVGEAVRTLDVELAELSLQCCDLVSVGRLVAGVLGEAVSMSCHHDHWRVSSTRLQVKSSK